jgi:hypothetical protein
MAQGKSPRHPVVIFHRGQALVGIQQALSDIENDALLLAVIQMLALDVRRTLIFKAVSLPHGTVLMGYLVAAWR